jgi:hypothetical protein
MKKTLSMLMALCMMLSLAICTSVSAFAAEDTITTGSGTFTVTEAVERLVAAQECSNLAGKHEAYHTALEHRAELDNIWADEEPYASTISWTNNSQFMDGRENVYAFYTGVEDEVVNWLSGAMALDDTGTIQDSEDWYGTGMLWYHMLMSPVIEVAGDGQTAVGLWQSFGTVTQAAGGGMSATWTMEDYTMVFAKMPSSGAWKIWHLRTFVHFYTNTDANWYEQNQASASKPEVEGYDTMVAASTSGDPTAEPAGQSNYSVNGLYYVGYSLYDVPVLATIPEPYETWADIEDTFAWGGTPLLGANADHQAVLDMQ